MLSKCKTAFCWICATAIIFSTNNLSFLAQELPSPTLSEPKQTITTTVFEQESALAYRNSFIDFQIKVSMPTSITAHHFRQFEQILFS